eukprot:TRINITY_DN35410_c0_g1_i7.p1 TRINITY_DN35410_c0_g1~~TRINITY_DN35410_c0_g1_i7.p1  ORF type:complete len:216 (+),score=22.51 TRINITY_DN35410_c0_g1_i7:88-735(+)
MPVAYPGLAVTVKNTFLHVEHGFRELSTPRTKKRRSSWSGGYRSTARDAGTGIHRDASSTLAKACGGEAEHEAPSAPRSDPASTQKPKPLLATSPQNYCSPCSLLEKPGVLHDAPAHMFAPSAGYSTVQTIGQAGMCAHESSRQSLRHVRYRMTARGCGTSRRSSSSMARMPAGFGRQCKCRQTGRRSKLMHWFFKPDSAFTEQSPWLWHRPTRI